MLLTRKNPKCEIGLKVDLEMELEGVLLSGWDSGPREWLDLELRLSLDLGSRLRLRMASKMMIGDGNWLGVGKAYRIGAGDVAF
jgi:hypothetical protein